MSEGLRRWPVLEHHPVTDHDILDGCVTPGALRAWTLSVREDYLTQNHVLHARLGHGMHLDYDTPDLSDACLRIGAPTRVAVSAGVGDVSDNSFTLHTRIRALDTKDELVATIATVVRIAADDGSSQPLGPDVRDAIAALEGDARHLN